MVQPSLNCILSIPTSKLTATFFLEIKPILFKTKTHIISKDYIKAQMISRDKPIKASKLKMRNKHCLMLLGNLSFPLL